MVSFNTRINIYFYFHAKKMYFFFIYNLDHRKKKFKTFKIKYFSRKYILYRVSYVFLLHSTMYYYTIWIRNIEKVLTFL